LPTLDLDLAKLHTVALAMVGRTSVSGVQRKISLGLSTDRMTLRVMVAGSQYLLKPQASAFPNVPENEHLTMCMARLCGMPTPALALLRLSDGSVAYIIRRFDRPSEGGKLAVEDFCQLAELAPKDKYRGSAELCGRLVRRHASEPGIELRELFRRWAFIWWTGNGDMHLKNFSLLRGRDGRHRLAPAYDLLSSRLLIPDDRLAMPLGGRDDRLSRRHLLDYADYLGLPRRAAERVLKELASKYDDMLTQVERSWLPSPMREDYRQLLDDRVSTLGA
jgi:serine/threonine-protein kinase HipA